MVSHGDEVRFLSWRGHLFACWDGEVSVGGVALWERELSSLVREGGRPIYVVELPAMFRVPSSEARAAIVRAGRGLDGKVALMGAVVTGEGFFSSAVRAMIAGLTLTAGVSFPVKIWATTSEMAAGVAAHPRTKGASWGTEGEVLAAWSTLRHATQKDLAG